MMMLLIGLAAGFWGFMMCFLPARWDRLTEAMSFADRWTEPSPKRLHPLIRFGNRIAGLLIFAVGCWFAYVAISEIYFVLAGRAASQTATIASRTLSNSGTPVLSAFSGVAIIIGILVAVFPAKTVELLERVWPAARSVTPSATPTVMLFVRLAGGVFVLFALVFLTH
jgi:hypothetical protein